MFVTKVFSRASRSWLHRVPKPSSRVVYPSHLFKQYSTSSVLGELNNASKRAPTSLGNTSRSFVNNEHKSQLNITDKKYADDGKLLVLDLTDRAVQQLNEISKEESNPSIALRVSVESGGCHGFQYNLELSDLSKKTEDDCIFERGNARVIIDESSLSILRESKVDYTKELIGSMFKVVDSPYTTTSCGCGSSFDFDFSKLEGGEK